MAVAFVSGWFSIHILSWSETLRLLLLCLALGVLVYRHRDRVFANQSLSYGASSILTVIVAFTVTQFDPATASLHFRANQDPFNPVFAISVFCGLLAGVSAVVAYRESLRWSRLPTLDRVVLVVVLGTAAVSLASREFVGLESGFRDVLTTVKTLSYGGWWLAVTRVYADSEWRAGGPVWVGRWVAPGIAVAVLWLPAVVYGSYRTLQVVDHLGEGQQAYLKEDWETAKRQYELAERLNKTVDYGPARDRYLEDLAVLQFRLGNEKEAQALVNRLRRATLDRTDGERKAADIYLMAERWWEAIGAYERVLDARPSQRDQDRLGLAYLRVRDVLGFEALTNRYAYLPRINAQTFDEHVFLGNIQFGRERYGSALEFYRAASEVQPTNAYAKYKVGRALLEQGQVDQAERVYRRVIELQPVFADAHYRLGRCLEAKSDSAGALAAFEKAVEQLPTHVAARSAVERLREGSE